MGIQNNVREVQYLLHTVCLYICVSIVIIIVYYNMKVNIKEIIPLKKRKEGDSPLKGSGNTDYFIARF